MTEPIEEDPNDGEEMKYEDVDPRNFGQRV